MDHISVQSFYNQSDGCRWLHLSAGILRTEAYKNF